MSLACSMFLDDLLVKRYNVHISTLNRRPSKSRKTRLEKSGRGLLLYDEGDETGCLST